MRKILVNVLKSALCVGLAASCLLATAPAQAHDGYPPEAYIATYNPYYYEGRPMYYYGGYWYYRNGRTWSHYDSEPRHLRDYRTSGAYHGGAHYYGRAHGGGYRHR
jgi:hypothetical protein